MSQFAIDINAQYPEDQSVRIGEAVFLAGPEVPKYTFVISEGGKPLLTVKSESWTLEGDDCLGRIQKLDKHLSIDVRELIAQFDQLDGHLGLAVHRGEGSTVRWKEEASELISAIRDTVKALRETL